MELRTISAVGIWFYSLKTDRYLFLLRNDKKNPNTWGLPGGKTENNETLLDTIQRECTEELGFMPEHQKIVPIDKFTSPDQTFSYHTFLCLIQNEFVPVLNHEHNGYAWINRSVTPKPLHPGLWATLNLHEVIQKIETARQNLLD